MTNIDVDDARALLAVVGTGSVSAAATELRLTQPAVTRKLQRLEFAVGAPLMDRNKRPFGLTELGRVAVERCRRLVAAAEELRALSHCATAPAREVRIGVAHALSEFALVEPIEELRARFPGFVWRLSAGWSRDLIARVKAGAIDAAYVLLSDEERPPRSLAAEAIAQDDIVAIAPSAARERIKSVRDLGAAEWILSPDGCAARAGLQQILAKADLPLRVAVETYSYALQTSLVARGRGLGFVPRRLLARSVECANLRTLDIHGLMLPMTIWRVAGDSSPSLERPLCALGELLAAQLERRPGAATPAPPARSQKRRAR
jgi:DNA-binding transcriptional LysR family regulator